MLKNKKIKVFLILAVLLFKLVVGVGCVSATDKQNGDNTLSSGSSDTTQSSTTDDTNNSENNEENNNDEYEYDDRWTGPGGMCPFVDCWSSNFTSFQNAFTKYDMDNYAFIAFDFDNLPIIGKKKYYYSALRDRTVFDPNYVYPSKYVFWSFAHFICFGVDSPKFTIKCEEIALIE